MAPPDRLESRTEARCPRGTAVRLHLPTPQQIGIPHRGPVPARDGSPAPSADTPKGRVYIINIKTKVS